MPNAEYKLGTFTPMCFASKATDGCEEKSDFNDFAHNLPVSDKSEVDRMFNNLSQEGKVNITLGETFWPPCFGMVTNRIGHYSPKLDDHYAIRRRN